MLDVSDNVPLIREKKLVQIKHPMDRLEGVGQSSIQKMPLGLSISEYNLGLVINSYILKITRLDIKRHPSLIVEMVEKLLRIGRGQNRIEQGDAKTEIEFIINEIYLNLIRYVNTQLD